VQGEMRGQTGVVGAVSELLRPHKTTRSSSSHGIGPGSSR
jgi:hypothetical protein